MNDFQFLLPDGSYGTTDRARFSQAYATGAVPVEAVPDVQVLSPQNLLQTVPHRTASDLIRTQGYKLAQPMKPLRFSAPDGRLGTVKPGMESAMFDLGGELILKELSTSKPLTPDIAKAVVQDPASPFQNWFGPVPKGDPTRLRGWDDYSALLEANRKGKAGFLEGLKVRQYNIPFYGAGKEAVDVGKTVVTANRIRTGAPVSDQDVLDLNLYLANLDRQSKASKLGKTGRVFTDMLTFMAEIGLSIAGTVLAGAGLAGGAEAVGGKLTVTAGRKALTKWAEDGIEKTVRRYAEKKFGHEAAEWMEKKGVRAAIRTAAAAPDIAMATIAPTVTQVGAQLAMTSGAGQEAGTRKGNQDRLFAALNGQDIEAAQAVWRGIGDTAIENWSESMGDLLSSGFKKITGLGAIGEAIGKHIDEIALASTNVGADSLKTAARTKGLAAVGTWLARKVATGSSFGGAIKQLQNVGYHGVLGEMLEERAGDFMRGLTGLQGEKDDNALIRAITQAIPTAEQAQVELMAFSMPFAILGGAHLAVNAPNLDVIWRKRAAFDEAMGMKSSPQQFKDGQFGRRKMEDVHPIIKEVMRDQRAWETDESGTLGLFNQLLGITGFHFSRAEGRLVSNPDIKYGHTMAMPVAEVGNRKRAEAISDWQKLNPGKDISQDAAALENADRTGAEYAMRHAAAMNSLVLLFNDSNFGERAKQAHIDAWKARAENKDKPVPQSVLDEANEIYAKNFKPGTEGTATLKRAAELGFDEKTIAHWAAVGLLQLDEKTGTIYVHDPVALGRMKSELAADAMLMMSGDENAKKLLQSKLRPDSVVNLGGTYSDQVRATVAAIEELKNASPARIAVLEAEQNVKFSRTLDLKDHEAWKAYRKGAIEKGDVPLDLNAWMAQKGLRTAGLWLEPDVEAGVEGSTANMIWRLLNDDYTDPADIMRARFLAYGPNHDAAESDTAQLKAILKARKGFEFILAGDVLSHSASKDKYVVASARYDAGEKQHKYVLRRLEGPAELRTDEKLDLSEADLRKNFISHRPLQVRLSNIDSIEGTFEQMRQYLFDRNYAGDIVDRKRQAGESRQEALKRFDKRDLFNLTVARMHRNGKGEEVWRVVPGAFSDNEGIYFNPRRIARQEGYNIVEDMWETLLRRAAMDEDGNLSIGQFLQAFEYTAKAFRESVAEATVALQGMANNETVPRKEREYARESLKHLSTLPSLSDAKEGGDIVKVLEFFSKFLARYENDFALSDGNLLRTMSRGFQALVENSGILGRMKSISSEIDRVVPSNLRRMLDYARKGESPKASESSRARPAAKPPAPEAPPKKEEKPSPPLTVRETGQPAVQAEGGKAGVKPGAPAASVPVAPAPVPASAPVKQAAPAAKPPVVAGRAASVRQGRTPSQEELDAEKARAGAEAARVKAAEESRQEAEKQAAAAAEANAERQREAPPPVAEPKDGGIRLEATPERKKAALKDMLKNLRGTGASLESPEPAKAAEAAGQMQLAFAPPKPVVPPPQSPEELAAAAALAEAASREPELPDNELIAGYEVSKDKRVEALEAARKIDPLARAQLDRLFKTVVVMREAIPGLDDTRILQYIARESDAMAPDLLVNLFFMYLVDDPRALTYLRNTPTEEQEAEIRAAKAAAGALAAPAAPKPEARLAEKPKRAREIRGGFESFGQALDALEAKPEAEVPAQAEERKAAREEPGQNRAGADSAMAGKMKDDAIAAQLAKELHLIKILSRSFGNIPLVPRAIRAIRRAYGTRGTPDMFYDDAKFALAAANFKLDKIQGDALSEEALGQLALATMLMGTRANGLRIFNAMSGTLPVKALAFDLSRGEGSIGVRDLTSPHLASILRTRARELHQDRDGFFAGLEKVLDENLKASNERRRQGERWSIPGYDAKTIELDAVALPIAKVLAYVMLPEMANRNLKLGSRDVAQGLRRWVRENEEYAARTRKKARLATINQWIDRAIGAAKIHAKGDKAGAEALLRQLIFDLTDASNDYRQALVQHMSLPGFPRLQAKVGQTGVTAMLQGDSILGDWASAEEAAGREGRVELFSGIVDRDGVLQPFSQAMFEEVHQMWKEHVHQQHARWLAGDKAAGIPIFIEAGDKINQLYAYRAPIAELYKGVEVEKDFEKFFADLIKPQGVWSKEFNRLESEIYGNLDEFDLGYDSKEFNDRLKRGSQKTTTRRRGSVVRGGLVPDRDGNVLVAIPLLDEANLKSADQKKRAKEYGGDGAIHVPPSLERAFRTTFGVPEIPGVANSVLKVQVLAGPALLGGGRAFNAKGAVHLTSEISGRLPFLEKIGGEDAPDNTKPAAGLPDLHEELRALHGVQLVISPSVVKTMNRAMRENRAGIATAGGLSYELFRVPFHALGLGATMDPTVEGRPQAVVARQGLLVDSGAMNAQSEALSREAARYLEAINSYAARELDEALGGRRMDKALMSRIAKGLMDRNPAMSSMLTWLAENDRLDQLPNYPELAHAILARMATAIGDLGMEFRSTTGSYAAASPSESSNGTPSNSVSDLRGIQVPGIGFMTAIPSGGATEHLSRAMQDGGEYIPASIWIPLTDHMRSMNLWGTKAGDALRHDIAADLAAQDPELTAEAAYDFLGDFDVYRKPSREFRFGERGSPVKSMEEMRKLVAYLQTYDLLLDLDDGDLETGRPTADVRPLGGWRGMTGINVDATGLVATLDPAGNVVGAVVKGTKGFSRNRIPHSSPASGSLFHIGGFTEGPVTVSHQKSSKDAGEDFDFDAGHIRLIDPLTDKFRIVRLSHNLRRHMAANGWSTDRFYTDPDRLIRALAPYAGLLKSPLDSFAGQDIHLDDYRVRGQFMRTVQSSNGIGLVNVAAQGFSILARSITPFEYVEYGRNGVVASKDRRWLVGRGSPNALPMPEARTQGAPNYGMFRASIGDGILNLIVDFLKKAEQAGRFGMYPERLSYFAYAAFNLDVPEMAPVERGPAETDEGYAERVDNLTYDHVARHTVGAVANYFANTAVGREWARLSEIGFDGMLDLSESMVPTRRARAIAEKFAAAGGEESALDAKAAYAILGVDKQVREMFQFMRLARLNDKLEMHSHAELLRMKGWLEKFMVGRAGGSYGLGPAESALTLNPQGFKYRPDENLGDPVVSVILDGARRVLAAIEATLPKDMDPLRGFDQAFTGLAQAIFDRQADWAKKGFSSAEEQKKSDRMVTGLVVSKLSNKRRVAGTLSMYSRENLEQAIEAYIQLDAVAHMRGKSESYLAVFNRAKAEAARLLTEDDKLRGNPLLSALFFSSVSSGVEELGTKVSRHSVRALESPDDPLDASAAWDALPEGLQLDLFELSLRESGVLPTARGSLHQWISPDFMRRRAPFLEEARERLARGISAQELATKEWQRNLPYILGYGELGGQGSPLGGRGLKSVMVPYTPPAEAGMAPAAETAPAASKRRGKPSAEEQAAAKAKDQADEARNRETPDAEKPEPAPRENPDAVAPERGASLEIEEARREKREALLWNSQSLLRFAEGLNGLSIADADHKALVWVRDLKAKDRTDRWKARLRLNDLAGWTEGFRDKMRGRDIPGELRNLNTSLREIENYNGEPASLFEGERKTPLEEERGASLGEYIGIGWRDSASGAVHLEEFHEEEESALDHNEFWPDIPPSADRFRVYGGGHIIWTGQPGSIEAVHAVETAAARHFRKLRKAEFSHRTLGGAPVAFDNPPEAAAERGASLDLPEGYPAPGQNKGVFSSRIVNGKPDLDYDFKDKGSKVNQNARTIQPNERTRRPASQAQIDRAINDLGLVNAVLYNRPLPDGSGLPARVHADEGILYVADPRALAPALSAYVLAIVGEKNPMLATPVAPDTAHALRNTMRPKHDGQPLANLLENEVNRRLSGAPSLFTDPGHWAASLSADLADRIENHLVDTLRRVKLVRRGNQLAIAFTPTARVLAPAERSVSSNLTPPWELALKSDIVAPALREKLATAPGPFSAARAIMAAADRDEIDDRAEDILLRSAYENLPVLSLRGEDGESDRRQTEMGISIDSIYFHDYDSRIELLKSMGIPYGHLAYWEAMNELHQKDVNENARLETWATLWEFESSDLHLLKTNKDGNRYRDWGTRTPLTKRQRQILMRMGYAAEALLEHASQFDLDNPQALADIMSRQTIVYGLHRPKYSAGSEQRDGDLPETESINDVLADFNAEVRPLMSDPEKGGRTADELDLVKTVRGVKAAYDEDLASLNDFAYDYLQGADLLRRREKYGPHVYGPAPEIDPEGEAANRDIALQLKYADVNKTRLKDAAGALDASNKEKHKQGIPKWTPAQQDLLREIAPKAFARASSFDEPPNVVQANRMLANALHRKLYDSAARHHAAPDASGEWIPNDTERTYLATLKQIKSVLRNYRFVESSPAEFDRVYSTFVDAYYGSEKELRPKTMHFISLRKEYVYRTYAAAANKSVLNAYLSMTEPDGRPLVMANPAEHMDLAHGAITRATWERYAANMANYYGDKFDPREDLLKQLHDLYSKYASQYRTEQIVSPKAASIREWSVIGKNSARLLKHLIGLSPADTHAIARGALNLAAWTKMLSFSWSAFFYTALGESSLTMSGIWKKNLIKQALTHPSELKKFWGNIKAFREHRRYYRPAVADNIAYMVRHGLRTSSTAALEPYVGAVQKNMASWAHHLSERRGKAFADKVMWFMFGDKKSTGFSRWWPGITGAKWSSAMFDWFSAIKEAQFDMYIKELAAARGYDPKHLVDWVETRLMADAFNHILGGQNWASYIKLTPVWMFTMNVSMLAWNWTLSAWNSSGLGPLTQWLIGNYSLPGLQRKIWTEYLPAAALWTTAIIPTALQAAAYGLGQMFGGDDDDVPLPMMNEPGRKQYVDLTPLLRLSPLYRGDPTGKRRVYVQFAKQLYETGVTNPLFGSRGWINEPWDQFMRKLSQPAKIIYEQITGQSPGSDWTLEFNGKGYMGWLTSGEPGLRGFMTSRTGYILQKFIPMSASQFIANPETFPFNHLAPTSKGASQKKIIENMAAVLETYASARDWHKIRQVPRARQALDGLMPEFMGSAKKNGYNPDKLLNTAKGIVLGRLYDRMWDALDSNDPALADKTAASIWRVGGTLQGLNSSLSNKERTYGREVTPEMRQQAVDALSWAMYGEN